MRLAEGGESNERQEGKQRNIGRCREKKAAWSFKVPVGALPKSHRGVAGFLAFQADQRGNCLSFRPPKNSPAPVVCAKGAGELQTRGRLRVLPDFRFLLVPHLKRAAYHSRVEENRVFQEAGIGKRKVVPDENSPNPRKLPKQGRLENALTHAHRHTHKHTQCPDSRRENIALRTAGLGTVHNHRGLCVHRPAPGRPAAA